MPTKIGTRNSRGDSTYTRIKYPQDYANGLSAAVDFMKTNKVGITEPVEQFSTFKPFPSFSPEYIKEGMVNTFSLQSGVVLPDKTVKMAVSPNTSYAGPYFNSGGSYLNTSLFKPQVVYDNHV